MIVGFHRVASDFVYTDSWKWGNSASEDIVLKWKNYSINTWPKVKDCN